MKWLNSKQASFLFNWILATVIGMVAGRSISLGFESERTFLMINLNWVSAIGIFITLTQWLVLQHIAHVKWWLITGFLGYFLAAMSSGIVLDSIQGVSFSNEIYRSAYNFFEGTIIGFSVSLIQWFSIRHAISNNKWWIFANAVGWGFGLMIHRFQPSTFEISYIPQRCIWLLNTLLSCMPIAVLPGFVFLKLPNLVSTKT